MHNMLFPLVDADAILGSGLSYAANTVHRLII